MSNQSYVVNLNYFDGQDIKIPMESMEKVEKFLNHLYQNKTFWMEESPFDGAFWTDRSTIRFIQIKCLNENEANENVAS